MGKYVNFVLVLIACICVLCSGSFINPEHHGKAIDERSSRTDMSAIGHLMECMSGQSSRDDFDIQSWMDKLSKCAESINSSGSGSY